MATLQERIKERFPEGLTAIFAPDGTRTSWAAQIQRNQDDPGRIDDFDTYTDYGLNGALDIINWFFELGGSNAIFEVLDIHLLSGQREKYAEAAIHATHKVLDSQRVKFYTQNNIDPYFTGIDSLLTLPQTHSGYQLARACQAFAETWHYDESRYKIVFNIAPIPILTIGRTYQPIDESENLRTLAHQLYQHHAQAAYGVTLPPPAFYLGQARLGDIKLNGNLPIALDPTGELRFFFTPYPSLYMKKEALMAILHDVLRDIDTKLLTDEFDYRNQITPELAQQLHARFETMAQNGNMLGLTTSS